MSNDEIKNNLDSKILAWFFIILIPPIGIPLMFKVYPNMRKWIHIIIYVYLTFWIVILFSNISKLCGISSNTSVQNDTSVETDNTELTSYAPQIEYDKLQQLYVDIDTTLPLQDMIDFLDSYGLPYSFEKYNGSRKIQVAFTKECTAQKYKKESGDYLTITYVYPKGENSSADNFEKYTFGTCAYNPQDSDISLVCHITGYYFSYTEPGNYISKLGTTLDLDTSMSRDEQMKYYITNK